MKLLKAERQDKILEILSVEKKIIASEMSVRLGVSEDTIRRDIKELDQKGLLKKVHSGAVRMGPAKVGFYQRMELDLDEKIRLAKKGIELIEPNSVYFGGRWHDKLSADQTIRQKNCLYDYYKQHPDCEFTGRLS